MVSRQLAGRDIVDERVLDAMREMPRHEFVPAEHRSLAYRDHPINIPCGQTISQPYIVALTLQALGLRGGERVLEIGTGSGYQAALLARLAGEIISVERHEPLAEAVRGRLSDLGFVSVEVLCADGTEPLGRGLFDAIAVSAAAPEIPSALVDQLAEGGRLVVPVGRSEAQRLLCLVKKGEEILTTELTPCRFVPLIGEQGFDDKSRRTTHD